MSNITVIKRNGKKVPLTIDKWQTQIAKVCSGIADVSQSMIEIKSQPHFYDGITTKEIDEIKISSTKIREAIKNGEIEKATKFLGKLYGISGVVIKGKQLGRTIGYPTANIVPVEPLQLLPEIGVYAVKIQVLNQIYTGLLNIGIRPTVEESGDMKLEVHIFDFSENLYDEKMQVLIFERICDEKKFASIEALKAQIKEDEIIARSYFMHLD